VQVCLTHHINYTYLVTLKNGKGAHVRQHLGVFDKSLVENIWTSYVDAIS